MVKDADRCGKDDGSEPARPDSSTALEPPTHRPCNPPPEVTSLIEHLGEVEVAAGRYAAAWKKLHTPIGRNPGKIPADVLRRWRPPPARIKDGSALVAHRLSRRATREKAPDRRPAWFDTLDELEVCRRALRLKIGEANPVLAAAASAMDEKNLPGHPRWTESVRRDLSSLGALCPRGPASALADGPPEVLARLRRRIRARIRQLRAAFDAGPPAGPEPPATDQGAAPAPPPAAAAPERSDADRIADFWSAMLLLAAANWRGMLDTPAFSESWDRAKQAFADLPTPPSREIAEAVVRLEGAVRTGYVHGVTVGTPGVSDPQTLGDFQCLWQWQFDTRVAAKMAPERVLAMMPPTDPALAAACAGVRFGWQRMQLALDEIAGEIRRDQHGSEARLQCLVGDARATFPFDCGRHLPAGLLGGPQAAQALAMCDTLRTLLGGLSRRTARGRGLKELSGELSEVCDWIEGALRPIYGDRWRPVEVAPPTSARAEADSRDRAAGAPEPKPPAPNGPWTVKELCRLAGGINDGTFAHIRDAAGVRKFDRGRHGSGYTDEEVRLLIAAGKGAWGKQRWRSAAEAWGRALSRPKIVSGLNPNLIRIKPESGKKA